MGLLSLAGSFFGPVGTAVGGVLDWLTGGSSSGQKQQSPLLGSADFAQQPLEGLSPGVRVPVPGVPTADDYRDLLLRIPPGVSSYESAMMPIPNYDPRYPSSIQYLADGRGGGGTPKSGVTSSPNTQVNPYANQAGGMASPAQPMDYTALANSVLGNAMRGNLDTTGWNLAENNLVAAANATGQQAKASLASNLGQRGMLNSGLAARGEADIAAKTAAAKASGLADLMAQESAQRQQMQMTAAQTAIDAALRQQQLANQARSLGISEAQLRQNEDAAIWGMVGNIAGAVGQLPGVSNWLSGPNSWLGSGQKAAT